MTGFGMGEYISENETITVEIKTVNHRYKDFNLRMNSRLNVLEDNARKLLGERINRGHAEVYAKYFKYGADSVNLRYDGALAKAYKDILDQIKSDFPDVAPDASVSDISRWPNVIVSESVTEDADELWEKFSVALNGALDMLDKARDEEGASLLKDFEMRIGLVERMVSDIQDMSESLAKQYFDTLCKNAAEYTQTQLDRDRLYTELAIYADRVNITEELVRLKSHIANFRKTLYLKEPVGRKLDFTVQEINREVNTIASKSNSFEVSAVVIDIKAELEKMREQIQNIE